MLAAAIEIAVLLDRFVNGVTVVTEIPCVLAALAQSLRPIIEKAVLAPLQHQFGGKKAMNKTKLIAAVSADIESDFDRSLELSMGLVEEQADIHEFLRESGYDGDIGWSSGNTDLESIIKNRR